MALNNGLLPPTVNFKNDIKSPINFVPNVAQKYDCEVILSNSFAFGGNNCCLAIGKEAVAHHPQELDNPKIVITGMGCCGVGGETIEELWETFSAKKIHITEYHSEITKCNQVGVMPEVDWKKYIPGKVIRRIDTITKLAMTAGKQALENSKLSVTRKNTERIGVVYATGTGPLGTIVNIDKSIIENGIGSISLSDFPNSVINAAPGNFCIANMLKGPTSTLSSGTASYLVALNYATELLNNDMADAVVMVGADECNDPLIIGNDKVNLLSKSKFAPLSKQADGMVLSPGAVAVMLETEKHALERHAKIIASIEGYASTSDNYHLGTVSPDGEELYACIKMAIADSDVKNIDLYINAAMGIPNCDHADINAMKKLINEGILDPDVSCSMVSPLLGVASGTNSGYGLLNALYAFINQEVVGVPSNCSALSEEISNYYSNDNKKKDIRTACVSTMALGGAYASLVLKKY